MRKSTGLLAQLRNLVCAAALACATAAAGADANDRPTAPTRVAPEPSAEGTQPPGCARDPAPQALLEEIVAAHERGDLTSLTQRLDPGMPGYGIFLDGVALDAQRSKLMRIHLFDAQWQCGPDLVALQTRWEKRYLDAASHQPALESGRMTLLLVRGAQRWRLAAVAGPHPFGGAYGARAVVEFGPVVLVPAGATGPTPVTLHMQVSDADLMRRGSATVQLRSASGDREVIALPAVAPGRFQLKAISMRRAPAQPGNGTLEVTGDDSLMLEYVDEQPGQGQAALLLRRTARVTGAAVGSGGTAGAFSITPSGAVGAFEANVDSDPVVVRGLAEPASVSVVGGLYSINGGSFVGTPGMVVNGDRIVLRVDLMGRVARTVTLSIGTRSANWTVLPFDDQPAPMQFASPTVAPGSVATSNTLVVSDITVPVPIEIIGGSYSVNGGTFTSAPGVIRNGQSLTLRTTAAALPGAVATVSVVIGGASLTWQVRTPATGTDSVPDPFTIPIVSATPLPGIAPARCGPVTTAATVPTGYDATTSLTVVSGAPFTSVQLSVAGGPFVSGPVAIGPGQAFAVRVEGFGNGEIRVGATPRVLATVSVGGVNAAISVLCS